MATVIPAEAKMLVGVRTVHEARPRDVLERIRDLATPTPNPSAARRN
jgi:acetylornithine deacetylase/succinyl-diaminopimelate desuccinylase-like protein